MKQSSFRVLVLNSGSSSIKFELFRMPQEEVLAGGLIERIGEPKGRAKCRILDEERVIERPIRDHSEGLDLLLDLLSDTTEGNPGALRIDAVGHRVVHGGEAFSAPAMVTPEVESAIEAHFVLAPLHNPPNLLGIRTAASRLPKVPQVAVFDTAFHQSMPARAYRYALPHELYEQDRVRRYGFHGTSHRFVTARAAMMLGREPRELSLISCHLGNGCSIAAVEAGRSVDTSMGLTPLEGLVMGTRSGDIDPSLCAFLAREKNMSPAEVDTLLNKKSGLLGLSGKSNDLRVLLEEEARGNERAALAIEVYCYRIRKYIGAYTAALGTLDAVIFTAGVGENSPAIRARVLGWLGVLGISLDDERNLSAIGREADIAGANSRVRVLVVPTNEELMIARDTFSLAFNGE